MGAGACNHGPTPRRTWGRTFPTRTHWASLVALAGALAGGCSGANKAAGDPDPEGAGAGDEEVLADAAAPGAKSDAPLPLLPITKSSFREHPAGVAWVFDGETENPQEMDIGQAEARGYTIIDLSNAWVPYIFSEKTPGAQDTSDNEYREMYVGLANDEIDSDGDKLGPWDHNYLELYGIPPSLQIVKADWEWQESEVAPCLEAAGFDPSVFGRYGDVIAFKKGQGKTAAKKAKRFTKNLERAMKKAKLDFANPADLEAAKTNPKTARAYAHWEEWAPKVDIIDHAQRRFKCERMFNGKGGLAKFDSGVYDGATTHALANFERKHDLMGWGHFKNDNKEYLSQPPAELAHRRLLRVIQERVVTSAGILEDGSAAAWKNRKKTFTYKDAAGKTRELRDVVGEFTRATIEALDLQTPESARAQLARLSDLGEGEFKSLLVAVKMPELPPYYGDNMQFSAVIDRGDIWYDFPYDEFGKKKAQPRSRYPHLTLYVHYNEQKIPLVHWRTTIGSWRNEYKDGDVWLKYKNSDVGDRVWRDIVAAPVWIPPPSTPPDELIKGKWKNGKFRTGVNYDEIGPGFRSAYGLVAAYHVKQIFDEEGNLKNEFDYSIRTHGSVDYMSILRRFSHGCHRLYNMDAVRLFSFILEHRAYTREGQQDVGVGRKLVVEEREYHMKIGTRGYKYSLEEPIPVLVTKGRVRGARKSPIEEYMQKPVPPEETMLEVDDGEGGTLKVPVLLPPSVDKD